MATAKRIAPIHTVAAPVAPAVATAAKATQTPVYGFG